LNCRDWKKRLPILLDEAPESKERRALAAHLAECPSCSGEWALLAQLKQESRKLPELEPGAHVWEKVRERLQEQPAEELQGKRAEGWWKNLLPAQLPKISWALAPAAAILLALFIFHWRQPAPDVAKVIPSAATAVKTTPNSTSAPGIALRRRTPVTEPAVITRMPERRGRIPHLTPDSVPVFVIETLSPQGQKVYVDAQAPDTELPVFVIHQGRLPEENYIPAPSNYLMPVVSRRTTDF